MLFGQVQAFIEVARTGNVSRAAEALYVTQPALTARIQALEKELGEALFVRTGRGVRLTDAGRVFLPNAERAVQAVDDDLHDRRGGRVCLHRSIDRGRDVLRGGAAVQGDLVAGGGVAVGLNLCAQIGSGRGGSVAVPARCIGLGKWR